MGMVEVGTG